MGKRDPYKFTIKFNAMDPMHRIAVKRLLTLDKAKATYIASLIISDLEKFGILNDIKAIPDPVPDTSTRPTSRINSLTNYRNEEKRLYGKPLEGRAEDYKQEENLISSAEALSELLDEENGNIIAATLGLFDDDDEDEEV